VKLSDITGEKSYLQPYDMLLNAIHDAGALQKGTVTLCDSSHGVVGYKIQMYGEEVEYRYTVTDTWNRSCRVKIEIAGEYGRSEAGRLIEHEFALLDYVLIDRAKVELTEQEKWEAQRNEHT